GSDEHDGFVFDAGPYILLDRPGLEWGFAELGLNLADLVPLRRGNEGYEGSGAGGGGGRIPAGLGETPARPHGGWPGRGPPHPRFVAALSRRYQRLCPLQRRSQPGVLDLLRTGAWREIPFLLCSLGTVLAGARLPRPVVDALAIWTHVAGQQLEEAPSPLAFVAALIQTHGAYYPAGGIGLIPRVLAQAATAAGGGFRHGTRVKAIRCTAGQLPS